MAALRWFTVLVVMLAASCALAESATFGRRAPATGDAVEQTVRVEMRLETTARKGAEPIESSSSQLERKQRRRVTATEIEGDRVVAAEVRFFEATGTHNGEASTEPVAGKQYHCARDGEKLIVTTAEGVMPPMEEYTLVVRAMETLGTASPLAKFLAGRTVSVGARIELPAEVAQQALGFDKQMGTVDRFELTLERIDVIDARRVARFNAVIETSGAGTQQMRMIVEGAFQIEEPTCRVVAVDLSGPIAMSGLRGVGVEGYQLDGRGKMRLALSSRYRDASR